ncbi:MAG: Fe-S biogenesis protein NfuA [Acidimicrobiia bacterium]|nr:MAG: Fe-S biogenesis protein NfuA [Acidimicrobiia bacterium]
MSDSPTITITDNALGKILELRTLEDLDDLHLAIRINGAGSSGFVYETAFLRGSDVSATDHVEFHGDLPVAIPLGSVDNLRGSVLDLSGNGAGVGLVIRNPNTPTSPGLDFGDEIELTGTPEEKVRQLLAEQINPAIASHGGIASVVSVVGTTANLELGGGCQGCGLAAVTLRQGIETAILGSIPEITEVVDVTNHDLGENPYF